MLACEDLGSKRMSAMGYRPPKSGRAPLADTVVRNFFTFPPNGIDAASTPTTLPLRTAGPAAPNAPIWYPHPAADRTSARPRRSGLKG